MSSRFSLTLALQIQAVAVAWQVYSLTKDPLSLGLVGLAEVIPAVAFALFAGHIVDRSNRKTILLLAQWMSVAVLVFLGSLHWLSALQVSTHTLLIYAAVFGGGIARAFFASSAFAFFGQIIPRQHYVRASAWNSTLWQFASLVGPACAGFLYAAFGPNGTYWIAAGLGIISIICISRIPFAAKIVNSTGRESLKESLTVGLKFVFRHRIVLAALSLDLFAVLFGGAVALLPLFADLLGTGPQGLGLLRAAPSLGAVVAVFAFAHQPPSKRAGLGLLAAVAGFGICMICFALSQNFLASVTLLAISGALDSVSIVVRSGILQLTTPDAMRGRVSAVNSIFISSSNELGAFESGLTAKWMGTVPSVIFGGCMTLVVVAVVFCLVPELRKLNLANLQAKE